MSTDRRRAWTYRGVTVVPERGKLRYFGCSYNFGHSHNYGYPHEIYRTRWWRVLISPTSKVLVTTKSDARRYIYMYGVEIDDSRRTA